MPASKLTLTARENEVLALAWQCFTTEPKVRSQTARLTTQLSLAQPC